MLLLVWSWGVTTISASLVWWVCHFGDYLPGLQELPSTLFLLQYLYYLFGPVGWPLYSSQFSLVWWVAMHCVYFLGFMGDYLPGLHELPSTLWYLCVAGIKTTNGIETRAHVGFIHINSLAGYMLMLEYKYKGQVWKPDLIYKPGHLSLFSCLYRIPVQWMPALQCVWKRPMLCGTYSISCNLSLREKEGKQRK